MNQSQISNLDRWGYPYLFDDFRFHMTLTSKVGMDRRDCVLDKLQLAFRRGACRDHALAVERISLMCQKDDSSSFRVIEQTMLRPVR